LQPAEQAAGFETAEGGAALKITGMEGHGVALGLRGLGCERLQRVMPQF
jgi:hypothetical protein